MRLTAARSFQDQIRPIHTWPLSARGDRAGVPALLDDHGGARPIEATMCPDDLYWQLVAERSWEPQWEWDVHQLEIVISWPHPYPRWDVWREALGHPSPVDLDLNEALDYRECRGGSTGLEYIASLFRRLQGTSQAGRAMGYLNDPSPVNAFMMWHRDIRDFVTDLAWIMAQSAGMYFYLDPRLGGIRAHADALVAYAGEGADRDAGRPHLQLSPCRLRDPATYTPPLLTAEVLGELAKRADEVAVALQRTPPAELRRLGAACSTCVFEPLDGGAFLWTPKGVFACVDEFYLLLAESVLEQVG